MRFMKLVIVVVIIILGVIVVSRLNNGSAKQPTMPKKPLELVKNDKIIVVKGNNVNYEKVKKALIDFCNLYNSEKDTANLIIPRLTKISENEFVITLPYDTYFTDYSFLINYLKYPKGISLWEASVTAWTTTKATDEWITEKSVNKKVMLFIPENDKEYDNVFLTTEDNIGYKLGFALGEEKQLLDSPVKPYVSPVYKIDDIDEKPFEDFQ